MRASKWLAGALAVLLLSSTVAGCTQLRTPYERDKIKAAGGIKKKEEGGGEKKKEAGGDQKSGEGAAKVAGGPEGGKGKTEQETSRPGKSETKAQEKERKKGQGFIYTLPKHIDDKSPRLMYSQSLSSVVSMVEGVPNATVLLDDDHTAYVAIAAPDAKPEETNVEEDKELHVKTEGDIPKPVQAKIAKSLRKSDPLVNKIYLTNDPHHVENFDRYAARSLKGDVDDIRSKALAEHIQDIWK